MKFSSAWTWIVMLLATASCAGEVDLEDGASSGGGQAAGGSPGTDGVGAGGRSADSGGSGAGGGASGGAATACQDFDDDGVGRVELLIINRRSTSIFLGPTEQTCGEVPPFELEQDGVQLEYFDGSCSASCAQLRDSGYLSCPAICLYPHAVELPPGESYVATWDARVHRQTTLPVECVSAEDGPETEQACYRREKVAAGEYTFSVKAGTELDCDSGIAPPECSACEPGPQGGCVSTGGMVGGEMLTASTQASLGELHLDESGPAAGGAVAPVEVIFTD